MVDLVNDLETAPPPVVNQAARDFARALAASPPFQAYEEAERSLRADQAAQRVVGAYQSKEQSTRMAIMLNSATEVDRAELARLHQALLSDPTVSAYLRAQNEVVVLCRAAADQLSRQIGLSFCTACGSGCCS